MTYEEDKQTMEIFENARKVVHEMCTKSNLSLGARAFMNTELTRMEEDIAKSKAENAKILGENTDKMVKVKITTGGQSFPAYQLVFARQAIGLTNLGGESTEIRLNVEFAPEDDEKICNEFIKNLCNDMQGKLDEIVNGRAKLTKKVLKAAKVDKDINGESVYETVPNTKKASIFILPEDAEIETL